MSEELTYEQKSNIVKELSSYYSSDEEIDDEICNPKIMQEFTKIDQSFNLDLDIIKGIFGSHFKKAGLNDDDATDILNNFYNNHPFLIPFVGKDYPKENDKKFLYVLESHYLPEFSDVYANMPKKSKNKNKWLKEQWYKHDFSWKNLKSSPNREISLYREDIEYMWTESVVKNNRKNNNRFKAMFEKMLNISISKNKEIEIPIESIAFMNYFLRPAENTGVSIEHQYIDSFFSYLNLIRVWQALGKPYIIICSAKARKSFYFYWKEHRKYLEGLKENIVDNTGFTTSAKFCLCNHPNNRSWNKPIEEDKDEKDENSEWNKNDTNSEKRLEDFMISINKSFAEIA